MDRALGGLCNLTRKGVTLRDAAEATILVTGATDGLGKHVASALARRGATVLVHGRSPERLEVTLEELRGQTSSQKVCSYLADLSSLAAVRDLADRILSEYDRLDVLVNNAGIIVQERKASEDGYELTFAVNYLSHFLLTSLLLPLLKDSAPARVVNVASAGQSPIDFSNLMLEQGYDAMRAYSQSKLAQVMFTFELAERLQGTGVTVNALHPASLMDTKMVHSNFGYTMSTVEEGARAVVRLAVSTELVRVTGRYFDGTREACADGQAYDKEAKQMLWELSEELCGRLLDPRMRQP
jgi:NAD(P)-dependent dehydrogenase (short-subunit alcohol dehydrogenase family)